jgi:hypothetical protein
MRLSPIVAALLGVTSANNSAASSLIAEMEFVRDMALLVDAEKYNSMITAAANKKNSLITAFQNDQIEAPVLEQEMTELLNLVNLINTQSKAEILSILETKKNVLVQTTKDISRAVVLQEEAPVEEAPVEEAPAE